MATNGTQDTQEAEKPTVDLTPPVKEPEGEGGGWAEKKEQRFKHWTERKEEERQKLASELQQEREARQKDAEERQRQAVELAELRGRMAASQEFQRQAPPAQKDSYDEEIADLDKQVMDAYAANDWDRARKLERKSWQMTARREAEQYYKTNQQAAPDPAQYILAAEFPWVTTNQQARMAADGWISILKAQGKPDNIETYREACRKAAEAMGLSKPTLPAATPAQRQLYGGTPPSRDTGGGAPTTYSPSQAELDMARRAASALGLNGEAAEEFKRDFMNRRASSNPDKAR